MSKTQSVPNLPELPTGATLDQVITWLQTLRTQNLAREPASVGSPLNKFVTRAELVGTNLLQYSNGVISAGSAAGGTVIIGDGGPGGGGVTPDLTPPSPITSLTATAGLTNFFIEFDAPTYAQGHGNAYTSIYAANYSGTGALPTFADAVEVYQVTGSATIAIIPAQIGTTTCFWAGAVTNDGVRQVDGVGPTGGLHGANGTTGVIGTTDLGPLIVEAGNLASGAVTASKLAAAAVDATKFASGIEPITIVSTIPGSLVTNTVFDTTDGKLYRWDGTVYTKAVPTTDLAGQITTTQITPNSITTALFAAGSVTTSVLAAGAVTASTIAANTITGGQIAAGAISAAQIAAGAISTDKLLVTGQGPALNADPTFTDPTAWTTFGGAALSFVGGILDTPGGGSTAVANTAGFETDFGSTNLIPIDAAKSYRMDAWFKLLTPVSASVCYLFIAWYDTAGAPLVSNVAQPTGAGSPAGWTNGTYSYGGIINTVPPTTWTRYSFTFGPTQSAAIPTNARFARIGALLNSGSNSGVAQVTGMRLMEMATSDLIVDGAITANKIAVNAIAVGTAAIENGAIINAMIGNAEIDDAKIADLSAGKLTSGSIAVGETIESTGYVPGSAGWKVSGNGNAEFAFAMIRGQLIAGQIAAGFVDASMINARGLSIEDASGNVILSAAAPLAAQIQSGGGNLYKNGDFALFTAGIGAPPDFFGLYNNSGVTVAQSGATTTGFVSATSGYWSLTPATTPTANFGFFLNGGWAGWQQNVDYVWSFYARAPLGGAAIGATFFDAWNHAPASVSWLINPPLNGGWQRYVVHINFGSNTVDANGFISISAPPHAGERLDFSCIQIETGTSASGFAPLAYVDANGNLQGTAVANSLLTSSIADKLSKSAPSILSSTVSINATSGAGFVAGTLTWNSSGVRTGGSGIAMTPGGLLGVNSAGVTTFSIDASTGNAFFGGTLESGIASKSTSSTTLHSVTTITGGATSISTGTVNGISSVTTAGGDLLLICNVNAYLNTNTNTPYDFVLDLLCDGTSLFGSSNPQPIIIGTMSNVKIGTAPYNWAVANNFDLSLQIPAGAIAPGSHTFSYVVRAIYFTAGGLPNTVTGSQLSCDGQMKLKESFA